MGDRGQVLIEDIGVYLYTHWDANRLIEAVKRAITKKQRWDDPEYLARIIFCEMVKENINGSTGYGIGTIQHGDAWRLIKVNCAEQKITIEDIQYKDNFENFIKQKFS